MLKNFTIFDLVVGIPAGLLIFMSTMMFSALLRSRGVASNWLELLLLALDAVIVGFLIRLSRKKHTFTTALASGVIGALVLLYLWLSSPATASVNPLMFGIPGVVVSFGFCLLGTKIVLAARHPRP